MPSYQPIITIAGIPFTADEQSWQFVPPKLFIGIVVAFLTLPDLPLLERILTGLFFGGLLIMVLALHILGHVFSSKLVAPPMTEARITPVLIETLYHDDPEDVPSRVHLIRSAGGPIMNFVLGGISLVILDNTYNPALAFFAWANLVIGIIVLLPFPSVDGGVIWREVFKLIRGK
jgi:Zn-dependent protease